MNMQRALARPLLAIAPILVVLRVAGGTAAAKGNDVKVSGTCSSGSHWKLKAGARDSGIETEFEVDSNKVGQVWSVRMTDNGAQVFAGNKTTVAPSGSFSVSRAHHHRRAATRSSARPPTPRPARPAGVPSASRYLCTTRHIGDLPAIGITKHRSLPSGASSRVGPEWPPSGTLVTVSNAASTVRDHSAERSMRRRRSSDRQEPQSG